jgi:hypothetical protein
MFIYSVTVTIKKEIEDEWVVWMKSTHLDEVMATGYFESWKMLKMKIPASTTDEVSYVVQYFVSSMTKYEEYAKKDAARLQLDHAQKFPGKFKAARAVLEEID